MADNLEASPDSTHDSQEALVSVDNSLRVSPTIAPVAEHQSGGDQGLCVPVDVEPSSSRNSPNVLSDESPTDGTRKALDASDTDEPRSSPSDDVQPSGLGATSPDTGDSQSEIEDVALQSTESEEPRTSPSDDMQSPETVGSIKSSDSQFDIETGPSDSQSGNSVSSPESAAIQAGVNVLSPAYEGSPEMSESVTETSSSSGDKPPTLISSQLVDSPLVPSSSMPVIHAQDSSDTLSSAASGFHGDSILPGSSKQSTTAKILESHGVPLIPEAVLSGQSTPDISDLKESQSSEITGSDSTEFSIVSQICSDSDTQFTSSAPANIPLDDNKPEIWEQSAVGQQQPTEYDRSKLSLSLEKCVAQSVFPEISSQSSSSSSNVTVSIDLPGKSDFVMEEGTAKDNLVSTSSGVKSTLVSPTSQQRKVSPSCPLTDSLSDSGEHNDPGYRPKRQCIKSGEGSSSSSSATTYFLRTEYLNQCKKIREDFLKQEQLGNLLELNIQIVNDKFDITVNATRTHAFENHQEALERLVGAYFEFADLVASMEFHKIKLSMDTPLTTLNNFCSQFNDSNPDSVVQVRVESELGKLYPSQLRTRLLAKPERQWHNYRLLVEFIARLVLRMIKLPFTKTLHDTRLSMANYHALVMKFIDWLIDSREQLDTLADSEKNKSDAVRFNTMIHSALQLLNGYFQFVKNLEIST